MLTAEAGQTASSHAPPLFLKLKRVQVSILQEEAQQDGLARQPAQTGLAFRCDDAIKAVAHDVQKLVRA